MSKSYFVLGLMSGTSLDGLDIAYCHIWLDKGNKWQFNIINTTTIAYSNTLKSKLKNAISLSKEEHKAFHTTYGKWLGEQSKLFIEKHSLHVDFIASHGHTSHHRPEDNFTFQLGNGQEIATISNYKVICDFRSYDVSIGGQGAPLVPIGDLLLFNDYVFCLNLGGISNISFQKNGERIAFDIGLANMPLNYITQKIGLEYDKDGKLAASGNLDEKLYQQLNQLDYYSLPHPKSTGYEWFINKIIPLIDSSASTTQDLLHTFIYHNCYQIANIIKENSIYKNNRVLVSGGGALNGFFIKTLQDQLYNIAEIAIPHKQLIEFKEALVFAFMGVLREEKQNNVLASVTGAFKDSCSGEIFYPLK